MSYNPLKVVIAALALAVGPLAHAGLILTGTRLVYHAEARDETIDVENVGKEPALMQAWIDDGRPEIKPEDMKVPFVMSPTLVRIDPGHKQTLRLVFTGDSLPKDRESLYWLNVLDIPPKSNLPANVNSFQFSVRTRIKLFYRPAGLAGTQEKAQASLRWTLDPATAGLPRVTVNNPSPYYVSLSAIQLIVAGHEVGSDLIATIPPFGHETVAVRLKDGEAPPRGAVEAVKYHFINDFGATSDGEQKF